MESPATQPSFKGKTCFIITPISNENSDIRMKAYELIGTVIKPVLIAMGFEVKDPLELSNPGNITNHIINQLIDTDLVIANLTGPNPNVMYELAVRHATNKPVVALAEFGTNIPFDIYGERAIRYRDSIGGAEPLKITLESAIVAAMSSDDQDNPIYRAIQRKLLSNQSSDGFEPYVLNTLDSLVIAVNQIQNAQHEDRLNSSQTLLPNEVIVNFKKQDRSTNTIDDLAAAIYYWSPLVNSYNILKKDENSLEVMLTHSSSSLDLFISNQVRDNFTFEIKKVPQRISLGSGKYSLLSFPADLLPKFNDL